MRISRHWLAERLPGLDGIGDLAPMLTALGLAVDVREHAAKLPETVVAAVVLRKRRLAAGGAFVCGVDAGRHGAFTCVCGAPNVRVRMRTALALPGTELAGGVVAKRRFGDVLSDGMLCSEAELGLGESHEGILELGKGAKPGVSLNQLLECDDQMLELELTPNRGDWLSLLGVARELAAKTGAALRKPKLTKLPKRKTEWNRSLTVGARIDPAAKEACPKFTCMPLFGVDPSRPTPALMAERLRRCGLRPVSAIVDITNYVMLELGQPLHAFDRDKLDGDINVRFAKDGERLTLLDGTEVALKGHHLLVADESRGEALAGVMGGLGSAVTNGTQNIVLEAAHFVPEAVRGRTREFKLSSEAAHRFERGVDPHMCELALTRAASLVLRHCGGSAGEMAIAGEAPAPRAPISFNPKRVEELIGVEASAAKARRILGALGCEVSGKGKDLQVVAPSWRFDLEIAEDLVEELVRMDGYATLPTTMPRQTSGFVPAGERLITPALARDRLVALGFNEVVTYSFVDPAWERGCYGNDKPLVLSNPLTSENSVMRSGLIPGLIISANYNVHRSQESLRLFELGRCFNSVEDQPQRLAGLCWGPVAPSHWEGQPRTQDYFDASGVLTSLLPGVELQLEPEACHQSLHPGRSAKVKLAGRPVGVVGELHPALLERGRCEIKPAPAVFELDFEALAELGHSRRSAPLSKLPLLRRDLALVVAERTSAGQLVESVKSLSLEELKAVEVFDSFKSSRLGEGMRGVGLRLTLQGTTENLVEERIKGITETVVAKLAGDHQARLRES